MITVELHKNIAQLFIVNFSLKAENLLVPNLLPGDHGTNPCPGVVNHGVGDDLGPGRQLMIALLLPSPDLNVGDGRGGLVLLLLPVRPEVGGQGGEGGGPAWPDSDRGEVSGGLGGRLRTPVVSDLGDTHSAAGHCQGLQAAH